MIKQSIGSLLLAAALTLSALPAHADNHQQAINWNDLPADVRQTLAPMADRWDKLKPQHQHRLVRRASNKNVKNKAERWEKLTPKERKRIKKARERFKDMPPEKRKELRERWENMSPEEKREAKKARKDKKDKRNEK